MTLIALMLSTNVAHPFYQIDESYIFSKIIILVFLKKKGLKLYQPKLFLMHTVFLQENM